MSKAKKIAENLGINLQPSQMGYVPSKPPRAFSGYNPEPDKELGMPITVDKNNRRRQVKALNGIKRKFESRYGEMDEAPLDPWQQKEQEYQNRYKSYNNTPPPPPPPFDPWKQKEQEYQDRYKSYTNTSPTPPPPPPPPVSAEDAKRQEIIKNLRDYRAKRDSEKKSEQEEAKRKRIQAEREAREKMQRERSRSTDPRRFSGKKRLDALEREHREQQGGRGSVTARIEAERERIAQQRYDATQVAAQRREERERKHREMMSKQFPDHYGREKERLRTDREEYLSRLKDQGRNDPSSIPDQDERPAKWYNKKIGLAGIGKQKEADKIGYALIHKTQMKKVKITPFGSGTRVLMTIQSSISSDAPRLIELYLQKNLKIILFSNIKAPVRSDKIVETGVDVILKNLPDDWKVAVDPFIRQKASSKEDKEVSRAGAEILVRLVSGLPSNKIADRQEFFRIRNEFNKKEQAASEQPPPHTHSNVDDVEEIEGEIETPEETRDRKRREAAEDAAFGRGQRTRSNLGVDDFNAEPEGRFRTPNYDDTTIRYGGEDDEDDEFYRQQAVGGMFGATDYQPRERRRDRGSTRKQPDIDYGSQGEFDFEVEDEPISEPVRSRERERERTRYAPPPREEMPPEGQSPFERAREKTRTATADVKRDSDDRDLMNQARQAYVGQFNSTSPSAKLIYYRALKAFGPGVEILDTGTSANKVIIRAPDAIEMHLTRKKYPGSRKAKVVTLTFTKLGSRWEEVFSSIPDIAYDPIMSTNPGERYKVVHKTDMSVLNKEVKEAYPDLLKEYHDSLITWANDLHRKNKRGIRGYGDIVKIGKSAETLRSEAKSRAKARMEKSRAKSSNESLAFKVLKLTLNEQIWYKEIVPVARKIQDWMLKHMGGMQITGEEIHNRFDEEHTRETVDKSIEILRANAVIYPMSNDVYMINMSRISSALM